MLVELGFTNLLFSDMSGMSSSVHHGKPYRSPQFADACTQDLHDHHRRLDENQKDTEWFRTMRLIVSTMPTSKFVTNENTV